MHELHLAWRSKIMLKFIQTKTIVMYGQELGSEIQ